MESVQGGTPPTGAVVGAPDRMLAGRYRLGARLGRGGMGTVWRATDEMLDREVAVKELSVGHLAEEDLQIVHSRMKQEARAAARIKHPGVIVIHDVLQQDGKPWIVMELIDGRSLAELVEQDGTLNPREAADIGAQVLAALHRGHQAGVIHRDVKPANVLLEHGTGRVVLTDFGIATYEGDSALTRTGDLVGSPDYLAPERVHGSRPGPASDLWALGATLFAVVEGESPFRRDSPLTTLTAVVTDPLPEPKNAGALTPVLQAMMAKEAGERPGAPEVIRMLRSIADGDTVSIQQRPSPLRNPTAMVPLVDRREHTPTPAIQSEPTRPTQPLASPEPEPEPETAEARLPETGRPTPSAAATTVSRAAAEAEQPRARARRRRRRIWPWLVLAGLLAGLAGGGLTYDFQVLRHRDSGATTDPSGSAKPSTSAAPSASASGGGTGPTSPAALPAGYTEVHDPYGFSFPLPISTPPFTRQSVSSPFKIDYSSGPDEQYLIRFGVTAGADQTLMQHIQSMQNTNPSIHMDLQPAADVFDGYPGVTWGWTHVKDFADGTQVPYQAEEQLFIDSKGTEYDIMVDYPQSDWTTTGYTRFETILTGFTIP